MILLKKARECRNCHRPFPKGSPAMTFLSHVKSCNTRFLASLTWIDGALPGAS